MTMCALVELGRQDAAVLRGTVPFADLTDFFGRAFTEVFVALEEQGLDPAGPPLGYYPCAPGELVVVEAGFPTDRRIEPVGEVAALTLPAGPAATLVHHGPYDTLAESYTHLETWASEQGLVLGEAMWESYLSGPGSHPDPDEWRTQIVWPVV